MISYSFTSRRAGGWLAGCVLFAGLVLAASVLPLQAQSLAVGAASGQRGTTVIVNVGFTAGTSAVTSLQFDLGIPAPLAFVASGAGAGASAAGKTVSASPVAGGIRVVAYGLNTTALSTGALALIQISIPAGAPGGTSALTVSGVIGSNSAPSRVSVSATGGSITVTGPSDTTPPTLSAITASSITSSSATVSWTTNEASDTQVDYGPTTAYGLSTALNTTRETSHSATLSGLASNTLYYYRVKSRDAAGNLATSGAFTFTTSAAGDTTPPTFTSVRASSITTSSATITWTTNEPSDTQVDFGTSTSYGRSSTLNTSRVLSHSVSLTGLSANTLYYYRVKSRDAAGNLGVSGGHTFRTSIQADSIAPIISGVRMSAVYSDRISMTWTTDEASDSQVEYGRTTSYGSLSAVDTRMVTSHTVTVSGLSPATEYHFRVRSRDAGGNLAMSGDYRVVTPPSTSPLTMYLPGTGTSGAPGTLSRMEDRYTGIAVANLGSGEAEIRFTAYDKSGALLEGEGLLNPVVRVLKAGEQLPAVETELFGAMLSESDGLGWIKVESSVDTIAAFFLMFDGELSVLDGASLQTSPMTTFVLPEVEDRGVTKVNVSNPDAVEATVRLDLVARDGKVRSSTTRVLPPQGALKGVAHEDLFPGTVPDATDYIRGTSDVAILPFELLEGEARHIEALNGQDAAFGRPVLYSPQFAVGGPWRSALSIVNLDDQEGSVTLRFIGDDGSQIGATRTVAIESRGKARIDDPAFFGELGAGVVQGYVEIRSSGVRLTGSVMFGDPDRNRFSSALPLVGRLSSEQVFAQVASNEVYFTGLAILNPNAEAVEATVQVFGADGKPEFTTTQRIPAGERKAQLLTELFPELVGQNRTSGYIKVTAGAPVAGFALFGTQDLSVLSAIPAQDIR